MTATIRMALLYASNNPINVKAMFNSLSDKGLSDNSIFFCMGQQQNSLEANAENLAGC
jgi:hypothetical protein